MGLTLKAARAKGCLRLQSLSRRSHRCSSLEWKARFDSLGLRRAVGKLQLDTGTAMSSDDHEPEGKSETRGPCRRMSLLSVVRESGRSVLYPGEALRVSVSMQGPRRLLENP